MRTAVKGERSEMEVPKRMPTIDDLRDPELGESSRLDSEWVVLNAVREMRRLASRGAESTYDQALEFGAELLPALLGPDVSLIKKARESEVVREFKQKAQAESNLEGREVSAVELLEKEIEYHKKLVGAQAGGRMDQVQRRLKNLSTALKELRPQEGSENQLIFRDALRADRKLPELNGGQNIRDYLLPDGNSLRIRVCHPDVPEHLTGADLIYERHDPIREEARVVVVQYKIWDRKTKSLYIDPRMQRQIARLKAFACDSILCSRPDDSQKSYRFPFCSAFLRPTDKLQSPDQRLITTGEHLPVCMIDELSTPTKSGKRRKLTCENIRNDSLSHHVFEGLFSYEKIGSQPLSYSDLIDLYATFKVEDDEDRVVIHAQEIPNEASSVPVGVEE